ncbi:MAG TPA: nuclear transport factor 2 family protein [Rhodocyclaceae bacterium]|nr:nuclear transport factor 2 family protein [Rhodocyclaceae bacterium]HRQ46613.1 nuclear transport factor 2 family protein [Rhodocyclaceae bacterium]
MKKQIFSSAAEVEAAFYEALARSDLEAMMSVWAEDEEVVCIHPDGPRQVGLAAVRESWRQLFSGDLRLVVRTAHQVVSASMLLTVHSVIEHISVEGDDRLHPPTIATNTYVRGALGWRMVMHHASTTPEVTDLSGQDPHRVVH